MLVAKFSILPYNKDNVLSDYKCCDNDKKDDSEFKKTFRFKEIDKKILKLKHELIKQNGENYHRDKKEIESEDSEYD